MNLGSHLKLFREKKGMSLQQVAEYTGITDSRLCRIEQGKVECPPKDLKKLSAIYGIPLIDLYLDAGYLTANDISGSNCAMRGIAFLEEEEKQFIQESIDFFNRERIKK